MELSKEQIQYIDHRLKNEGIKFWDIRIEMLDHVVSNVEQKLKPENSEYEFREKVQDVFENLGWKENFNGGGLDHIFQKTLNDYAKNNRKSMFEYCKSNFTNLKSMLLLFLFWTYLYTIHNNALLIKYTIFFCFFLLLISVISFFIKYKVFQSTKLNSLLFLVFFPMAVFNVAISWPKFFFGFEKLSNLYLTIIVAIIIPFLIIGVNFLYKEFKVAQNTYNKLIKE